MPRGSTGRSCQLHVNVSSVQPGIKRFPDGDAPVVADGRNNLTAISPELDLYFVAERDHILVFRPCFPTQELGEVLYGWHLPSSRPGLRGYIDPRHPHAVNSMLITKLGTQEVLICACDDGDVIAYYTRFLREISIAKDFECDEDWPPCLEHKLLMIENVGKSAWGLAVHTNARKLAISCNTHNITVFAFALTDDAVLYNDPQTEWQYPGRAEDDMQVLRSHLENVPNIAFFNSDLDKEGRYLVSTDLGGMIVIWDLRESCEMKRLEPFPTLVHRSPYSGWSVACVDPRAFLLVTTEREFLGHQSQRDLTGTYDITRCRLKLQDSSIHHPDVLPSSDQSQRNEPAVMSSLTRAHRNLLRLQQQMEQLRGATQRQEIIPQEQHSRASSEPLSTNNRSDEDIQTEDPDLDNNIQDRTTDPLDASLIMDSDSNSSPPDTEETNVFGLDLISEDMSNSPMAIDSYLARAMHLSTQNLSSSALPITNNYDNAPFLLIHTGQDFVSLRTPPYESLSVVSRDPCQQYLPGNMMGLLQYDRLHLSQLIPELNIFVTATAVGRVAIFTLTRRIISTKPVMKDEYAMRLDFIVPFTSQEIRKERPNAVLVGLAAAPIQGHHSTEQRWRLALMYRDHTIMSYELWRNGRSSLTATFI